MYLKDSSVEYLLSQQQITVEIDILNTKHISPLNTVR